VTVGSHHHPPMLILDARIIHEERLCIMKEEDPAQHIFPAQVPDKLRMAPSIPHRNAEMMVAPTDIIGDPGLCPGKHKNPRLAVATNLVLDKCRP